MSEAQYVTDDTAIERDLSAFQQAILAILAEEPRYGLAVKRELEYYYGSDVNHGRLYPNLDELVDMGLVEKSELDKRTNQYALTDQGHTAILKQLEWTLSRVITDGDRAEEIQRLVDQAQQ